jgi:dipeptidyl aminopeptidase/acylaminoacyl peptidase
MQVEQTSERKLMKSLLAATSSRRTGAHAPRHAGPLSLVATLLALLLLLAISACAVFAQQSYQKPQKEIQDVLDAAVTPSASINPTRDYILLAEGVRYPPLAELAQPMLRLAGMRINPNANTLYRDSYFVKLRLLKVAGGSEVTISLPPGLRIGFPLWSPDGKHFLFSSTTASGMDLWLGETDSGRVKKLKGVTLNSAYGPAAFGPPARWLPDNRTLLVPLVPANRSKPPAANSLPSGPRVQESLGKTKPARTFQDMLTSPYDEDLFDYYSTSQLALVDTSSGKVTLISQPAIFQSAEPSPDGKYLLVTRLHRPYSYALPHTAFPKEVEVWDTRGNLKHHVASFPLADQVPIEGVPVGPRICNWKPTAPATLYFVEALDHGDPKEKVPYRDRLALLDAPFNGTPAELTKTENRLVNLQWGEQGDVLLVTDYDRDKRWATTRMLKTNDATAQSKVLWSLSVNDRYNNPGSPLAHALPNGYRAMIQHGDWIYLTGPGASPEGDRPFLDRFNLQTLKSERLFRSDATSYEAVITLLNDDGSLVLTRREKSTEPLNLFVRSLSGSGADAATNANSSDAHARETAMRPLTHFPDPTPQLRDIKKQLVTYKRADGVQLSFTLYLPPGYKEGTRVPTVLWAYPLEFGDSSTAGQVTGSTQRFTTFTGPTQLFFLLAGYAVLNNATMPIVGDPETVNNTFVEQVLMDAQAAVDKAVEMGVADPDRVGVAGHSYGAFMTANLLAHSKLFRAGIALSGAYNRTLTPFGFQNERRTLWEAPELYTKVSPFMSADKIKEPLLLIHGDADDNEGTFPLQSERLYQAISGLGGTVRLVNLPLEAHTYESRESIEHTLYEMIRWFDKYVKNAPPRAASSEKVGTKQ